MVNHIVDTRQIKDRQFLEGLFKHADEMKELRFGPGKIDKHKGRVVANFFYQPSTRTKMSFDNAAKRIGAEVVGTENAREFSSAFKGEKLEHSLLALQEGWDIVVMRHHEDGAAKRAASVLAVPFINAGDGKNQHPTQAFLDLYTIDKHFGKINGLRTAFVGDISQGRTIKSLAYLLAHLDGNEMYFVSPPELCLPEDMKMYFRGRNIKFHETEDLDGVLSEVDVLYDTRLQTEHAKNREEEVKLLEKYRKFQITWERAERMSKNSILMHPLPINTEKSNGYPEIVPEVDKHPRAHYFRQSNNGLYVRMALLDVMLSGEKDPLYQLILDVP